MELSQDKEMREEISELLEKLVEPSKIEEGYNAIISGRNEEGISILEPYEDDERFNSWWSLRYYLGVAYKELGSIPRAEELFIETLKLSPSNIDAMKELVDIYSAAGDQNKC